MVSYRLIKICDPKEGKKGTAARGAVGGADGADDARFEQGGMDTNVFSANLLISEIEASARRRHPAAAVW